MRFEMCLLWMKCKECVDWSKSDPWRPKRQKRDVRVIDSSKPPTLLSNYTEQQFHYNLQSCSCMG
eukprot:TRINITY_DN461_c0_g3_i3.p2 TRINITY_DN461_c0_g3~~TRINITY_DN461_c0_g3_i3.p2  ORF type:complete len:65 (+),score=6.30 TRINITY_DN461_c0_g3_i3:155-349(+)